MSDKSNQTISAKEFRQYFISEFKKVGAQLDVHDRYQIAINLKIALETVKRYMDKELTKEIRNFELAEILPEPPDFYFRQWGFRRADAHRAAPAARRVAWKARACANNARSSKERMSPSYSTSLPAMTT